MGEGTSAVDEVKALSNAKKAADKEARGVKRAAETARGALSDKQAELDACRRAEDEAIAQMAQSTQVLACW